MLVRLAPSALAPLVLGALALVGCGGEQKKEVKTPEAKPEAKAEPFVPPAPVQEPLVGGPYPTLLLGQAQFYAGPDKKPVPGPALLSLWRQTDQGWKVTRVEDPESNVFHKAIPYEGGIVTIGAEKALLKKWTFKDGAWSQETLWAPAPWGGKFNRIRDLEIGDVNGDQKDDFVMATHDAGVIAVGQWKEGKLEVTELDKTADTFVHEIEIGDIDKDGVNEFFATPSGRNMASGESQPGQVVMYKWDGSTWKRSVVDDFTGSHAKEILAYDIDGDRRSELFSVVEAESRKGENGQIQVLHPVEIRQYTMAKDGTFSHKVVGTIDDKQTRFLIPADFDGDRQIELVAAAMKTGLWLLERGEDGNWTSTNIERNSGGFEHTAYAADLDGNGAVELYVAADTQRELRRYTFNPETRAYDKTVLGPIPKDTITWNATTGSF